MAATEPDEQEETVSDTSDMYLLLLDRHNFVGLPEAGNGATWDWVLVRASVAVDEGQMRVDMALRPKGQPADEFMLAAVLDWAQIRFPSKRFSGSELGIRAGRIRVS